MNTCVSFFSAVAVPHRLQQLAQLILDGNIPRDIVLLLGGGALIPSQNGENGVRPLVVGETLRRLTARAACFQVREEFLRDILPHQFAVGVTGGCEVIHKAVNTFMLPLWLKRQERLTHLFPNIIHQWYCIYPL